MLISHRKRFVYTKTVKTAGTSVESYFEPHCMRPGEWEFSHGRGEYESEAGVVGVRSGNPLDVQAATWWNHMPAKAVRALAGPDVWGAYFKFCVVRNPFDKMVSAYKFFTSLEPAVPRPAGVLASLRHRFARPGPASDLKAGFENWLRTVPLPLDRNKYTIDGRFCMDYVIRYESLAGGIREVCERLDIEFRPDGLPHLKKSEGPKIPVEAYYSPASIEMVERAYQFELETFGYTFPRAGRLRAA